MPSNKELIKDIEEEVATKELTGEDVPVTKDKSNNELVSILAELKKPAVPTPPAPTGEDEAAAEEEAAEEEDAEDAETLVNDPVLGEVVPIAPGEAQAEADKLSESAERKEYGTVISCVRGRVVPFTITSR